MFIRESSFWSRFERSNKSKGTGSLLDKIFFSAAGVPELNVLTCLTISSREVRHKSLCSETRILPRFTPDWPGSAPVSHKTQASH